MMLDILLAMLAAVVPDTSQQIPTDSIHTHTHDINVYLLFMRGKWLHNIQEIC